MNYQFLYLNDNTIQKFMDTITPSPLGSKKKVHEEYTRISEFCKNGPSPMRIP